VQYISPVDGIAPALTEIDPALGSSELIFPSEDVQARLKVFNQELSAKDEEKFDARFAEITGS
jgi:hypothetical protein